MHEFAVMEDVVGVVLKEAEERRATDVKEVILEVGTLTFLAHEQLRFAYDVLTKGTVMEGSALMIHKVEAEVRCSPCQYTGTVAFQDDPAFHTAPPIIACPKCMGSVEVVHGRECKVTNIKMRVPGDDEKCSS